MKKELLMSYGYTDEQIEKIMNDYVLKNYLPEILCKNIKRNYQFFLKLGYSKEQIIKMTISVPSIYSYSMENIRQKIENMVLLGYSKEQIIKMTISVPSIYSCSMENIQQKIENMVLLGYSKEQIIKMTISFPNIFGVSMENIQQKIEDMISLGYSKEQIIKMTVSLPNIYGLNIENIKEKIFYLRSVGLDAIYLDRPKCLMQSVDLIYARYEYLTKIRNMNITYENVNYLFLDAKRFEKKFGISKLELLEQFNYNREMGQENERTL